MQLSYGSSYTFLKKVDALRTGPKWDFRKISIKGDLVDEDGTQLIDDFELWLRNPVDCITELISNPAFDGSMAYVPERVYTSSRKKCRIFDEMWMADWWWDVQVSAGSEPVELLSLDSGKNRTGRCCLPSNPIN
jgi:hypothetical protein